MINYKSQTANYKFRKYSNLRFACIYENPREAGQIPITKLEVSKFGIWDLFGVWNLTFGIFFV